MIFESQRSPQTQVRGRKPAQIFPAVPDRNVINQETIDLVDNPSFISQPSGFDNPSSLGNDQSGFRPKPSVFDDQFFDLGKGSNSAQEEQGFDSLNPSTQPPSIFPTQILRTSTTTSRPLQQTSPVPTQGKLIVGTFSRFLEIFIMHLKPKFEVKIIYLLQGF